MALAADAPFFAGLNRGLTNSSRLAALGTDDLHVGNMQGRVELHYLALFALALGPNIFLAQIDILHHHSLVAGQHLQNLPGFTAILARQHFHIVTFVNLHKLRRLQERVK